MARINEFTSLGEIAEVMADSSSLRGMRIAITGHLGRPRADVARIIEMAGGVFQDRVAGDTTHLLTNSDWSEGSVFGKSTKYMKAKRMGVRMISEKDFYDILCKTA
jgi:NAD-dependent DNA ligase